MASPTSILAATLGNQKYKISQNNWQIFASKLSHFVFDQTREQRIENLDDITSYFERHWELPTVEIEAPTPANPFLRENALEFGRFSIRIINLLDEASLYIVLNKTISSEEKRLAFLHEIGHMSLHFDMLQTIATLYYRICLNPLLEYKIGSFFAREGAKLKELQEIEADLFALTWFIPLNIDFTSINTSSGLTDNGRRYWALRNLFVPPPINLHLENKVGEINKRGTEAKNIESKRSYPVNGTLMERLSWALYNRPEIRSKLSLERSALLREYFEIIGPPVYIPELSGDDKSQPNSDAHFAWIQRVGVENLETQLQRDNWEPFVLETEKGLRYPDYYIPITPIPSESDSDLKLNWQHMIKSRNATPLPLTEWIERSRKQKSALLIFARTPAEKLLDQQAIIR